MYICTLYTYATVVRALCRGIWGAIPAKAALVAPVFAELNKEEFGKLPPKVEDCKNHMIATESLFWAAGGFPCISLPLGVCCSVFGLRGFVLRV